VMSSLQMSISSPSCLTVGWCLGRSALMFILAQLSQREAELPPMRRTLMWCASTCRTTSSDACVASIHTGFTTFSAMTWAALSSDEHGDDHYYVIGSM
jgi:hypothetical protein